MSSLIGINRKLAYCLSSDIGIIEFIIYCRFVLLNFQASFVYMNYTYGIDNIFVTSIPQSLYFSIFHWLHNSQMKALFIWILFCFALLFYLQIKSKEHRTLPDTEEVLI